LKLIVLAGMAWNKPKHQLFVLALRLLPLLGQHPDEF
jgi:hypothetical protein